MILVFFSLFFSSNSHVFAQNADISNIHIDKIYNDEYQLENIQIERIRINEGSTNNHEINKTEDSWFLKFLDSKFAPPIISATISALITIVLFVVGRKVAKNQLIFDIALKSLLPSVYLPIISILKKYEYNKSVNKIEFSQIETIIMENYATILFAPNKTKELLLSINSICKDIHDDETYNKNKEQLHEKLKSLEEHILKRFGALIG